MPQHAHGLCFQEYFDGIRHAQRLMAEEVEDNTAQAQHRQRRNYPIVEKLSYKVGDQVMLHNPAVRRGPGYKLTGPWTGPFRVLEILGHVNYRIRRVGGGRSRVVHYNRLKPFMSRDDMLSSSLGSESLSSADSSDGDCPSSFFQGSLDCPVSSSEDEDDFSDENRSSEVETVLSSGDGDDEFSDECQSSETQTVTECNDSELYNLEVAPHRPSRRRHRPLWSRDYVFY